MWSVISLILPLSSRFSEIKFLQYLVTICSHELKSDKKLYAFQKIKFIACNLNPMFRKDTISQKSLPNYMQLYCGIVTNMLQLIVVSCSIRKHVGSQTISHFRQQKLNIWINACIIQDKKK